MPFLGLWVERTEGVSRCPKRQERGLRYGELRMNVKREQLFTDLEALSEEQIEVGLEAGVWGDPARAAVVARYLEAG